MIKEKSLKKEYIMAYLVEPLESDIWTKDETKRKIKVGNQILIYSPDKYERNILKEEYVRYRILCIHMTIDKGNLYIVYFPDTSKPKKKGIE